MKKNLGSIDRIIRVFVAVIVLSLYFVGILPGTLGIALSVLALVLLLTSMIAFCPLYLPFGLNTLRKNLASKNQLS